MTLEEKIKCIKRSFRPLMNGVTATSMRQKGTHYKLNWGVSQMDLQRIAEEYGKDKELAIALWLEDIRECKILATLIMPAEQMPLPLAEEWLTQIPTQEMAEWAAFHLFQHIDGITPLALCAIRSANMMERICGYHILSRLFLKGTTLDEASEKIFHESVETSLKEGAMGEKHAAINSLSRYER
ncbi:MAG: DNA alkylation repair protein [Prevotella sp.]|nr:DNA alkylation repair protein [Prevotella sp.]